MGSPTEWNKPRNFPDWKSRKKKKEKQMNKNPGENL